MKQVWLVGGWRRLLAGSFPTATKGLSSATYLLWAAKIGGDTFEASGVTVATGWLLGITLQFV